MTTIKATCPTCGDVDLTPAQVTVNIAHESRWSTYTFTCARCSDLVCKPADDDVVQLLTGAGARVERLTIPSEYLESRVLTRTGPPITGDEVLDFALWLVAADDIVGMVSEEI